MTAASGLPAQLDGERVWLRGWDAEDATALSLILADNQTHLTGWIPAAISRLEPVDALRQRLLTFQADATAGLRERRALVDRATGALLGGIDLFGRTVDGRVPLDAADRLEVGYWIRRDATGRGFVTEAVHALLRQLPPAPARLHVEIRCDARNVASRGVAERLGFRLATREPLPSATSVDAAHVLETWVHPLPYVSRLQTPSPR